MKSSEKTLGVVQNEALFDRVGRISLGAVVMFVSIVSAMASGGITWEAYAILLAIYPLLTGMLGWDPLYALTRSRSCNPNGRKQCGTFPYEIDAMLGGNPSPDKGHEFEHSLSASHHEPVPHNK